jgi:hypothetical protein
MKIICLLVILEGKQLAYPSYRPRLHMLRSIKDTVRKYVKYCTFDIRSIPLTIEVKSTAGNLSSSFSEDNITVTSRYLVEGTTTNFQQKKETKSLQIVKQNRKRKALAKLLPMKCTLQN